MCSHPAFYGNLCVGCGLKFSTEDLQELQVSSKQGKVLVGQGRSLTYNSNSGEVQRVSRDKLQSLTSSKKIALVLDLDHTLLHSIQVDGPSPTAKVSDCDCHGLYHLPVEVGVLVLLLFLTNQP
jgi:hypothetical protein